MDTLLRCTLSIRTAAHPHCQHFTMNQNPWENLYLALPILSKHLSSHVLHPFQSLLVLPQPPHRQCLPTHPRPVPLMVVREGILPFHFFSCLFISAESRRVYSD